MCEDADFNEEKKIFRIYLERQHGYCKMVDCIAPKMGNDFFFAKGMWMIYYLRMLRL